MHGHGDGDAEGEDGGDAVARQLDVEDEVCGLRHPGGHHHHHHHHYHHHYHHLKDSVVTTVLYLSLSYISGLYMPDLERMDTFLENFCLYKQASINIIVYSGHFIIVTYIALSLALCV